METDVRPTKRTHAQQTGAAKFRSIKGIPAKRAAEEISATLLTRICGRVHPTEDVPHRLGIPLDQLIAERRSVQELTAALGLPE